MKRKKRGMEGLLDLQNGKGVKSALDAYAWYHVMNRGRRGRPYFNQNTIINVLSIIISD